MIEVIDKIDSFKVDHTILEPGFYLAHVDGKDNDIITYDLRFKKPNGGAYLSNSVMHTIEHMMATTIRNFFKNDPDAQAIDAEVIYFGPMGCQTGFYLVMKSYMTEQVNNNIEYFNNFNTSMLNLVMKCIRDILNYEGEVYGNSEVECGHYITLDLAPCKKALEEYLLVLNKKATMSYMQVDVNYPGFDGSK